MTRDRLLAIVLELNDQSGAVWLQENQVVFVQCSIFLNFCDCFNAGCAGPTTGDTLLTRQRGRN